MPQPRPATAPAPELAPALERLQARIRAAEAACGRPAGSVRLLAVTKTFGPQVVAAAAALGLRAFGENYVQEAVAKIGAVAALAPGLDLEWHFIGPIQSNKTRLIATHFQWVQSIERLNIAQRLAAQRPPGLPPLQVLLEVNISGEASKSGIHPQELPALATQVAALPALRLRGLMAIPEPQADPQAQRRPFARLRELFLTVQSSLEPGVREGFDTLSMGMSGDFEAAINEGSTLVRVGSALFGERQ